MSKPAVTIIGPGKVGCALGYLLLKKGYPIAALAGRSEESLRRAAAFLGAADTTLDLTAAVRSGKIVLLTVSDRAIAPLCRSLAEGGAFFCGQLVLHCSGALSSGILEPARRAGALAASLHPLQTFASPAETVGLLPGSYYTFEGDDGARGVLRRLVGDLGGNFLEISSADKPLYHAAAVMACNYLVTLLDMSLQVCQGIGISREQALKALWPLVKGTVSNIERVGIPGALTGPVERADKAVLEGHLAALEALLPGLLPLYKALGARTVALAEAKGTVGPPEKAALRELFKD